MNLLLTAEPTGVAELLEVTSAQAAANPALAKIRFPVAGSGLSVSADGLGNLTAADAADVAVFTAPAPQMWDSAGGQSPGGASSATPGTALGGTSLGGPVPGDHTASVGVSVSAGSVALTPAGSVLAGPQVVYPVFIDPRWDGYKADATWLDVWKDGAGNVGGDWDPTDPTFGGIKSGVYCQDNGSGTCVDPVPDSTWGTYRSYINFTLPSGFAGSNPGYVDAQLQIYEKWSWSCTKSTLELWQTNHADKGSTWNSRPQQLTKLAWPYIAYGHGSGCPAQTVFMNVTPALQNAAQPGYGSSTVTFELRASDTAESGWDVQSWKRFDASSMDLVVYWRNAPSLPTGQGAQGVFNPATGQAWTDCSTSSSSPDWASTASPAVQATINDMDSSKSAGAGNIDGFFPWTNVTTGATGTLHASQNGANDQTGQDPYPDGALFIGAFPGTAGDVYSWQAYGTTLPGQTDPIGNAIPQLAGPSTSMACYVGIDTTAPSTPTVTSSNYVSGSATNPVGTPGQFTFSDLGNSDGGVNDVAGYEYGFNAPPGTSPGIYVPAPSQGGQASVTFTPFNTSELDMYVAAVDRAGNVSSPAEFKILTTAPTNGIATLAWWKLADGSGSTASDSANDGHPAALSASGASWGGGSGAPPDTYTAWLKLDGTSGQAATAQPVAGNNGSFSVSAWVNPSACSGSGVCAAVSQDGVHVSGFTLGYQGSGTAGGVSCPCWVFEMPASDSSGAQTHVAAALAGSGALNSWTQLTGTFDLVHQQLSLYVDGGDGKPGDAGNGQAAATATAFPWSGAAPGPLRLGAGFQGGPGLWQGGLSDGCAFYGVLQPADVQALYAGGTGDGCTALFAEYP